MPRVFARQLVRRLLRRNEGAPHQAHLEMSSGSWTAVTNKRGTIMHGLIEKKRRASYCEDGLKLRQKLQKLRWMGLDSEADEMALAIGSLHCGLPKAIAANIPQTD